MEIEFIDEPDASQEVSPEVFPYNGSSIDGYEDDDELVVAHLLDDNAADYDDNDDGGGGKIALAGRPPSPYHQRYHDHDFI